MNFENANFDISLLDVLACPLTKTPLEYSPATNELISKTASLVFPIKLGIPVLLLDKARKL